MGFLDSGSTLTWEEAKKHADYIREHGIKQFLAQYRKVASRSKDHLKWGDEIEYIIATFDHSQKRVRLCLSASELLPRLQQEEHDDPEHCHSCWRPEYGSFMLEGTPGQPYGYAFRDILHVEPSMKYRRELLKSLLRDNEAPLQLTAFPMMGVDDFTEPHYPPRGYFANSYYVPDECINPHPRFGTLSRNIRLRRGSNVSILRPLYRDTHTLPIEPTPPPPRREDSKREGESHEASMPDISEEEAGGGYVVHMDAMAFGMGCCCLQCTFQCCNVYEARSIYDQLAVLSPIIMAITAASPIFRGYLVDTDVRWDVISKSVDDRTREERGLDPLKDNKRVINKSRYDSIDCFISQSPHLKKEHNDLDLIYDEKSYQMLRDNGVDELLSRHLAHLFIRDPLVIYSHKIEIDDDNMTDHFENIQSTNWQSVRFKLPPPNSSIGWRVEFRTMELSLTDFENAAFVTFIQLLIRTINVMELNFYVPISAVDHNMKVGQMRDAVRKEKFWFRNQVIADSSDDFSLMTMNQIINGNAETGFPGLINLIEVYLDTTSIRNDVRSVIENYMVLVSKRASGELLTTATWMRDFVTNHPEYKHDSIVSQQIAYDLIQTCTQITDGRVTPPSLLGHLIPLQPRGCVTSSCSSSCSSSSSSNEPCEYTLKANSNEPLRPTSPSVFPYARVADDTDASYLCEKCGTRHSKHTIAQP